MDDLISRQDALTEIRKDGNWLDEQGATSMTTHERELRDTFILREIPSAQKKGHWKGERLKYPSGLITFIYRCSECGHEERHAYEDTKPSNFCPHCGAYMNGEK